MEQLFFLIIEPASRVFKHKLQVFLEATFGASFKVAIVTWISIIVLGNFLPPLLCIEIWRQFFFNQFIFFFLLL